MDRNGQCIKIIQLLFFLKAVIVRLKEHQVFLGGCKMMEGVIEPIPIKIKMGGKD
jgi:hypothetical protein